MESGSLQKGTFEEELDDSVLNILVELKEKRIQEGTMPDHVMFVQFQRAIRDTLNRLHLQKKIKVGDTMNDKYIQIL